MTHSLTCTHTPHHSLGACESQDVMPLIPPDTQHAVSAPCSGMEGLFEK